MGLPGLTRRVGTARQRYHSDDELAMHAMARSARGLVAVLVIRTSAEVEFCAGLAKARVAGVGHRVRCHAARGTIPRRSRRIQEELGGSFALAVGSLGCESVFI